jgi:Uma2 family endonuclease
MSVQTIPQIDYPSSDGRPMAESDLHRDWMICIIERLQRFFAGQWVYVSGNLLIYYFQGNPKRCVAPDAFVVKDCDPKFRTVFKTWEEARLPNFVLETTSATTQENDLDTKMELYTRFQVAEYFLYDPRGDWLSPALIGYQLLDGEYEPITPDAKGNLPSAELGVTFGLEQGRLEMWETRSGKRLTSGREEALKLQVEQTVLIKENLKLAEKLTEEAKARQVLEEELRRLRAERGKA